MPGHVTGWVWRGAAPNIKGGQKAGCSFAESDLAKLNPKCHMTIILQKLVSIQNLQISYKYSIQIL